MSRNSWAYAEMPSTPGVGDQWYDIGTGLLKVWSGTQWQGGLTESGGVINGTLMVSPPGYNGAFEVRGNGWVIANNSFQAYGDIFAQNITANTSLTSAGNITGQDLFVQDIIARNATFSGMVTLGMDAFKEMQAVTLRQVERLIEEAITGGVEFAPLINPPGGQNNYAPLNNPVFTGTIDGSALGTSLTNIINNMIAAGGGVGTGYLPLTAGLTNSLTGPLHLRNMGSGTVSSSCLYFGTSLNSPYSQISQGSTNGSLDIAAGATVSDIGLWTARNQAATGIKFQANTVDFYSDGGLTIGATYGPTTVFRYNTYRVTFNVPIDIASLPADPTPVVDGLLYYNNVNETLRFFGDGAWRTLWPAGGDGGAYLPLTGGTLAGSLFIETDEFPWPYLMVQSNHGQPFSVYRMDGTPMFAVSPWGTEIGIGSYAFNVQVPTTFYNEIYAYDDEYNSLFYLDTDGNLTISGNLAAANFPGGGGGDGGAYLPLTGGTLTGPLTIPSDNVSYAPTLQFSTQSQAGLNFANWYANFVNAGSYVSIASNVLSIGTGADGLILFGYDGQLGVGLPTTFAGAVTLAGNAVSALQAVPLQQVQALIAAGGGGDGGAYLPLAGGTLTGSLTIDMHDNAEEWEHLIIRGGYNNAALELVVARGFSDDRFADKWLLSAEGSGGSLFLTKLMSYGDYSPGTSFIFDTTGMLQCSGILASDFFFANQAQTNLLYLQPSLSIPTNPINGFMYYNNSTHAINAYINGAWKSLGGIPEPTGLGSFLRAFGGSWVAGLPLSGGTVTGALTVNGALTANGTLWVMGTTSGIIMTHGQFSDQASPPAVATGYGGRIYWNQASKQLRIWDGDVWKVISMT